MTPYFVFSSCHTLDSGFTGFFYKTIPPKEIT